MGTDNKYVEKFYDNGWIKQGLLWGLIMFIICGIIFNYLMNGEITTRNIIIAIPLWTVAGLAYGYFVKRYALYKENAD